jgi:hypothetical protein
MIEATLEKLNNSSMKHEVVFQNDTTLNLDVEANQEMYGIISGILKEHGIKDAGLCGGGFEHYPLEDGMTLAIGWNSEGPTKFYLGKMGRAF